VIEADSIHSYSSSRLARKRVNAENTSQKIVEQPAHGARLTIDDLLAPVSAARPVPADLLCPGERLADGRERVAPARGPGRPRNSSFCGVASGSASRSSSLRLISLANLVRPPMNIAGSRHEPATRSTDRARDALILGDADLLVFLNPVARALPPLEDVLLAPGVPPGNYHVIVFSRCLSAGSRQRTAPPSTTNDAAHRRPWLMLAIIRCTPRPPPTVRVIFPADLRMHARSGI